MAARSVSTLLRSSLGPKGESSAFTLRFNDMFSIILYACDRNGQDACESRW
jgi:hypothetical protein